MEPAVRAPDSLTTPGGTRRSRSGPNQIAGARVAQAAPGSYYRARRLSADRRNSGVYENDTEQFARAGNNGALLLTGRLNLFDGLATRSKVNAAHAELSRARVLAEDLRRSVALEVETAYRTLLAAQRGLEVARRDIAYAQRALTILEDRYGFRAGHQRGGSRRANHPRGDRHAAGGHAGRRGG